MPLKDESEFPDLQTELPLFSDDSPLSPDSATLPEANTQRLFLGWNSSILESASTRLLKDSTAAEYQDLSDHLIIVPTRNAGRRLREFLALRAAESGIAILPPLVTTQDYLASPDRFSSSQKFSPSADRQTTRLIWSSLLLDVPLNRFKRLFPAEPVSRDLSWAMKTASELLNVRNLLVESNLTFSSAAAILTEHDMEPARWSELSELEKLAISKTEELGLFDEGLTRIEASQKGSLTSEIRKIVVIGTPDITPLSCRALSHYGEKTDLEILIPAPDSESHRFDHFGRPIAVHWLESEITISEPNRSIHDAATPAQQAELACELIENTENPASFVAVGAPDSEVVHPLEQSAARRSWTTHDPAGISLSRHGVFHFLKQTAALLSSQSFESTIRLLACQDVGRALCNFLRREHDIEIGATRYLQLVDELHERCFPDRLDDAIAGARRNFSKTPELETGLTWIEQWIARFQSDDFSETLSSYLSEIFAQRKFSPTEQEHGAFSEVASAILDANAAFTTTESAFSKKVVPAERFQLLLELIRERHLYEERKQRDIDLQGWLELLWEDAPHLIVTGMNDHVVPESIIGHAFLPDSARRTLGIPCNDDRFARDAFLLTSAVESRRTNGKRLDLIFGRQSESGDPLRPSRLLFQCPDKELPQRTLQFFDGSPPSHQLLPWSLPWQLKPAALPGNTKIFQRLSVTQFRSYLTCPFRFYLQHGLRMEEIDAEKTEMDARDFGNLIHDTLERFGRDPEASVSTEVSMITECFEREIDNLLYKRFGSNLTTPVLIQREAARRRLAWWAEIEAQQRIDGWRILEPETNITTEDHPFEIGGLPVSGRIDRIEEHEDGRLRVFDFKTHAVYDAGKHRNKTVREFHIAPIKRTEDPGAFPDWSKLEDHKGKPLRWTDLQIPLYLLALTERYPDREISAGHVAIGPSQAEIVLDLWDDLDGDLLQLAKGCAEGVVSSVQSRLFWPPAERYPWSDPFEELLLADPEESVDPARLSDRPNSLESA